MNKFLIVTLAVCLFSCVEKKESKTTSANIDQLAEKYVRLGLAIGEYDSDFVDAYYGPDSLKPTTTKQASFPKDSFLVSVNKLIDELKQFKSAGVNDTNSIRATWISEQLVAFSRRIKIFSGETVSFDVETKELFGVTAPTHNEAFFKDIVSKLDTSLKGKGSIAERFQLMAKRFIIPKDMLDTVFRAAIAESRKRTLAHYSLPPDEKFSLEFVHDKSWSGYNWYKGNFTSLIQVNTDLEIFVERAIDVASHESYPGHHVYNMLLEKNLYRDKGWIEISLYPLFCPQSLIAEGSANYGIELAFPGKEKNRFAKELLLPLAKLDTAGLDHYFEALELKGALNYVKNEVARGLLDHTMDEPEALRWLVEYGLNNEETAKKSLSFIKKYRSYVINYNYGKDLVKYYIETEGDNTPMDKRWQLFGNLLSNEVLTSSLIKGE
ncbi:MAG: hypothetical protein ABIO04_11950 [Ferruginibacter sp.]